MSQPTQTSESELEAAIVAQGAVAQALHRIGMRAQALAAFGLMRDLIARRAPETVARMKEKRGRA